VPRAACLAAALAIGLSAGGCSSKKPDAESLVAARPYLFKVPTGYDSRKPTPLVIMLHGYGATALAQEGYFQLGAAAEEQTFLYAYPDGTVDPTGRQFWNADDACCDFFASGVDDVAYVNAIIDDVSAKFNVDPKRIFVVGHSNGAFMSHRLACDLSSRIAAIASLAGAVWNDPAKCNPTDHVSVLDVHGNADLVVSYDGGAVAANLVSPGVPSRTQPPYPSEAKTTATWAAKNGCTGALVPKGLTLDLDTTLVGAETAESAYAGCPSGIDVELWTIAGGSHVPILATPTWAREVYGFFSAHPKL
jgi:polyhydroxybutyrate depolymerase